MNNQLLLRIKKIDKKIAVPVLVVVIVALAVLLWWIGDRNSVADRKLVPPVYKQVSADATHDISILIKKDSTGMYFEWNGIRLSSTSRVTGLLSNTQYMFTITNNTSVKEGIFIPALSKNLVINPGQSSTTSVSFESPGTHYFLGNIYQAGWTGLISGFDVVE